MFGGFALADWTWLALLAGFGARPAGPIGVLTLAAALVHLARGRPRVHLALTYVMLLAVGRAVLLGGLAKDTVVPRLTANWVTAPAAAAVGIAVSIVVTFFMHWLLPLDVALPRPSGPWHCAVQVFRLQRPSRGVDVMVRCYHPTHLPRDSPVPPKPFPYLLHGGATAAGFASAVHVPGILFGWLQYLQGRVWDSDPEAAPLPPPGARAPRAKAGEPAAPVAPQRWPVLIFSHGRSGTPDCYSTIIADLVSHGWVVMAPDHADGSAAYTAFPDGNEILYEPVSAAEERDIPTFYRKWHKMLKYRVAEAQAVLDLVESLDGRAAAAGGAGKESEAGAGADADPTPEQEGDDMKLVRAMIGGSLDATRVAIGGHSFGAATAIATAEKEPTRLRCVLSHDVWAFPLSAMTVKKGLAHLPVLSICGDGFTRWRENAVAVRLLLSKSFRAKYAEDAAAGGASADGGVKRRVAVPHASGPASDGVSDGPSDDTADGAGGGSEARVRDIYLNTGTGNGVAAGGIVHKNMVVAGSAVHPAHSLLTLSGAMHQNFNDFAIIVPGIMRRMKMVGPADPTRLMRSLCAVSRAFLEQATAPVAAKSAASSATSPARRLASAAPPVPALSAAEAFVFTVPPEAAPDLTAESWEAAADAAAVAAPAAVGAAAKD